MRTKEKELNFHGNVSVASAKLQRCEREPASRKVSTRSSPEPTAYNGHSVSVTRPLTLVHALKLLRSFTEFRSPDHQTWGPSLQSHDKDCDSKNTGAMSFTPDNASSKDTPGLLNERKNSTPAMSGAFRQATAFATAVMPTQLESYYFSKGPYVKK